MGSVCVFIGQMAFALEGDAAEEFSTAISYGFQFEFALKAWEAACR